MKYFVFVKITDTEKSIYMYDQAVHELAIDEFTGDILSRSQNVVKGMGSEIPENDPRYPAGYNYDLDFGFNAYKVFGDDYFNKIVPQLATIAHDILQVTHFDLHCKNDKYYNKEFKSCFHLLSIDIVVGPDLRCYLKNIMPLS